MEQDSFTAQLQAKRNALQFQIDELIQEIQDLEKKEFEIAKRVFKEAQEKVEQAYDEFTKEVDNAKNAAAQKRAAQAAVQNQEELDEVREQLNKES